MTPRPALGRNRLRIPIVAIGVVFAMRPAPAVAQNPAAVMQSAASVAVTAQVIDPAVTAWVGEVGVLADSLMSGAHELADQEARRLPAESRLHRFHAEWVVQPSLGSIAAEPLVVRSRRLRITVAFAAN